MLQICFFFHLDYENEYIMPILCVNCSHIAPLTEAKELMFACSNIVNYFNGVYLLIHMIVYIMRSTFMLMIWLNNLILFKIGEVKQVLRHVVSTQTANI